MFVYSGTSRPKILLAPLANTLSRTRMPERLSHSSRLHWIAICIPARLRIIPLTLRTTLRALYSNSGSSADRADLSRTRCLRELSAKSVRSPFPFEPLDGGGGGSVDDAKRAPSRHGGPPLRSSDGAQQQVTARTAPRAASRR